MSPFLRALAPFSLAAVLAIPSPALAQDAKKGADKKAVDAKKAADKKAADAKKDAKPEEKKPEEKKPEEKPVEEKKPEEKKPEEAAKGDEEKDKAAEHKKAEEAMLPSEDGVKTYVGARGRYLLLPKFLLSPFFDGGASLSGYMIGGEYVRRRRGFETAFGLSYAALSMSPIAFKNKNDDDVAWEIVGIDLSILYATIDFLWSTEVTPELSLLLGGSTGLGFTWGTMTRHQATPNAVGPEVPGDPTKYVPCPANAAGTAKIGAPTLYCNNDNDHYGRDEASWFNGGSKPSLLPWLAVQTGARFDVSKQVSLRLDIGFGITGFFAGLAAHYGIM